MKITDRSLLMLGCDGPDVEELQRFLAEKGYYRARIDGFFGTLTRAAVREYQADHGLKVDGMAGPITLSLMFPEIVTRPAVAAADPEISALAKQVVMVCSLLPEIRETNGPNRSPFIDKMTRDLGLPLGVPWCMVLVQWVFKLAGAELGLRDDPLKPDTGGCLDLWYRVPREWRHGPREGKTGDIGILDWGGGSGHTFIVKDYSGGVYRTYSTYEGNTNKAGSREGDGFYQKDRKWSMPQLKGFIRVPMPAA